jgi:uncharacterized membrane protein
MPSARLQRVDALRGFALLWMTGFHFCFDLASAGLSQANFYADPFWTRQRTCILSLFLLCAGAGQALAIARGQSWRHFAKRWLQISGCALLVSAGSYLMFPQTYIYFGVLHGMAVMLLVCRALASRDTPLRRLLAGAGVVLAACLAAPELITQGWWSAALNGKGLNWLGLISAKPFTEDYVPLAPWLAVMLGGMAAMLWAQRRPQGRQAGALEQVLLRPFAFLGRWSLSYYMLHQPVMLGGLALWQYARVIG